MNRHNLPLAWHAATDMSVIGWVMIAYSSNCLISPGWLASVAEGDSIINAALLYYKSREKGLYRTEKKSLYSINCNKGAHILGNNL